MTVPLILAAWKLDRSVFIKSELTKAVMGCDRSHRIPLKLNSQVLRVYKHIALCCFPSSTYFLTAHIFPM